MSKLKKIVIYLFFLCLGMHSAFSETPEQITFSYISINEGLSQSTVFSIDQLSHLHFHLAPKYVDGPDYGGIFQMNPGKVYLTDAEYQELIDAVRANL